MYSLVSIFPTFFLILDSNSNVLDLITSASASCPEDLWQTSIWDQRALGSSSYFHNEFPLGRIAEQSSTHFPREGFLPPFLDGSSLLVSFDLGGWFSDPCISEATPPAALFVVVTAFDWRSFRLLTPFRPILTPCFPIKFPFRGFVNEF
jgi:hypothetical protein